MAGRAMLGVERIVGVEAAAPRQRTRRNRGTLGRRFTGRSGRELAALSEDGADRGSICTGDDEHCWIMGRRVLVG
jgi:hypothetical protein